MSKNHPPDEMTPSICEEALDRFSESDDSLAEVIESNSIEVRDFMLLTLVCDQKDLQVGQLVRALGLSRYTVLDCIERLIGAGLIEHSPMNAACQSDDTVSSTPAGRTISRRILDGKAPF